MAQYNYEGEMLRYFKAVKDTTSFLGMLINHVDNYLYTLNADSIEKAKAAAKEIAKEHHEAFLKLKPFTDPAASKINTLYIENNISRRAPVLLNNYAWDIFETGTLNPLYLTKALLWSRRSVKLDPQPYSYDTLAQLLYRFQFYAEAEQTEIKAIKLLESKKSDTKQYKEVLTKIRTRKL